MIGMLFQDQWGTVRIRALKYHMHNFFGVAENPASSSRLKASRSKAIIFEKSTGRKLIFSATGDWLIVGSNKIIAGTIRRHLAEQVF